MGTIQQLINDLRAWKYLVAGDVDTPSPLPTTRLHTAPEADAGQGGAPRFDDPPGRAA